MLLPTRVSSRCKLCSRCFVGSDARAAASRRSSSCWISVGSSLAIGGGVAPALRGVVGEVLAEADAAGVVEIEAEADGAQGAGEGGEEVGGGGFVIPNVGTTAVAAAGMIVNAFEAVEFAIGGAEA